jgi:alkylated DNA nucleotide flippase Atl1
MTKVVIVSDLLSREQGSRDLLTFEAVKSYLHGLRLVKLRVDEGDDYTAILLLGSGNGERGHLARPHPIHQRLGGERVTRDRGGKIGGLLKVTVHLEDMIGRREHHVALPDGICENHALQHVNDLCDVDNADAVSMTLKDVERQGCHHGVDNANGRLALLWPEQRHLLQDEGVTVKTGKDGAARIQLKDYHWNIPIG